MAFEYALTGWFAVRLGASYVAMLAPTWKVDSNYDLLGVPSNVNGNGFMVNLALLSGLSRRSARSDGECRLGARESRGALAMPGERSQ